MVHHKLPKQVLLLLNNIRRSVIENDQAFNISSYGLFGGHLSCGNQSTVL